MDFDALWVGDKVFVRSFSKNGIWEGRKNNEFAFVKIDHKQHTVSLSEISEAKKEEEIDEPTEVGDTPTIKIKPFQDSLDLHIERLNPSMSNQPAQLIINHQIKRCITYIEEAIERKRHKITIIHGIGEGVLKSEVYHLLKEYDDIKFSIPVNNGGAVELWFNYS